MKKGVNKILFFGFLSLMLLVGVVGAVTNIDITYPVNGSYYSSKITQINLAVTPSNITNCWWDDGSTNTSFLCSDPIISSGVLSNEDWNTWTVYANDSGNVVSKEVTFWVDSILPVINILTPLGNVGYTNLNLLSLFIQLTETNKGGYIGFSGLPDSSNKYVWRQFVYPDSSGSEQGSYSLNGSDVANSSLTPSVLQEGNYSFNLKVRDVYPDGTTIREILDEGVIIRDVTNPSIIIDNPSDSSTQFQTVQIDVTSTDIYPPGVSDISGISSTTIQVWNGVYSVTDNSDSFAWDSTLAADGYYNITSTTFDRAGNSNSTRITIMTDNTAPLIYFNSPAAGIYNSMQTVNITAFDLNLDTIELYVNGSIVNSTSTTEVLYTLGEGNYSVYGFANDTLGNTNQTETRNIMVDLTNPVTTDDALAGWQTSDQTINLAPTDNLAGVNTTLYCTDQIDICIPINFGTSVVVSTEGINYVRYHSTDNAGNVELNNSVQVWLDKTDPITTNDALSGWQAANFNVTLTSVDAVSGVNYTMYNYNGMGWQQVFGNMSIVEINQEGNLTLQYYHVDVAGNVESTTTIYIALDTSDPIVDAGTDALTNSLITQDATVDGSVSGVANYSWTQISGPGNITFGSPTLEDTNLSTITDGVYTLRLTVTDNAGNSAFDDMIFTWDTTSPVITLVGVNPQTVEALTSYTELGATALDNIDGNLNGSITIDTSFLNINLIGSYDVVYNVQDTAGNTAQLNRTVNVVDTTIPVITLIGSNPQTVELGSSYVELNATSMDNYDGDISTSIVIVSSTVNTSALGSYSVTYDVMDSSGNTAQLNRTVNVVDTVFPLISYDLGTEADNSNLDQSFIFVNVSVTELSEDTITFELYNSSGLVSSDSFTNGTRSISWLALLDGTYYYSVTVNDTIGNTNSTATRTITLDTTDPVLGLPTVTGITTTASTVAWTTNELSDSTVYYWVVNGTVSSGISGSMVTSHAVTLTGLTSSTLYYFNVSSCDPAGNCDMSLQYNFTTASPASSSSGGGGSSGGTSCKSATWECDFQGGCVDGFISYACTDNCLYTNITEIACITEVNLGTDALVGINDDLDVIVKEDEKRGFRSRITGAVVGVTSSTVGKIFLVVLGLLVAGWAMLAYKRRSNNSKNKKKK